MLWLDARLTDSPYGLNGRTTPLGWRQLATFVTDFLMLVQAGYRIQAAGDDGYFTIIALFNC